MPRSAFELDAGATAVVDDAAAAAAAATRLSWCASLRQAAARLSWCASLRQAAARGNLRRCAELHATVDAIASPPPSTPGGGQLASSERRLVVVAYADALAAAAGRGHTSLARWLALDCGVVVPTRQSAVASSTSTATPTPPLALTSDEAGVDALLAAARARRSRTVAMLIDECGVSANAQARDCGTPPLLAVAYEEAFHGSRNDGGVAEDEDDDDVDESDDVDDDVDNATMASNANDAHRRRHRHTSGARGGGDSVVITLLLRGADVTLHGEFDRCNCAPDAAVSWNHMALDADQRTSCLLVAWSRMQTSLCFRTLHLVRALVRVRIGGDVDVAADHADADADADVGHALRALPRPIVEQIALDAALAFANERVPVFPHLLPPPGAPREQDLDASLPEQLVSFCDRFTPKRMTRAPQCYEYASRLDAQPSFVAHLRSGVVPRIYSHALVELVHPAPSPSPPPPPPPSSSSSSSSPSSSSKRSLPASVDRVPRLAGVAHLYRWFWHGSEARALLQPRGPRD